MLITTTHNLGLRQLGRSGGGWVRRGSVSPQVTLQTVAQALARVI